MIEKEQTELLKTMVDSFSMTGELLGEMVKRIQILERKVDKLNKELLK